MTHFSSRRQFLQKAISSTALLATAPVFLHAEDKAGSKTPIVGEGEFRYQVTHDWCQLPTGFQWATTHGVCIDSAGHIYIKQLGRVDQDTIFVFDPSGKLMRSFGKAYARGGHGIDVRKEGKEEFLYLSDIFNRQVIKTTLKGEEVWKKGFPMESKRYPQGKGYRPTNIAFAPDGGFYVGDGYGSHFIHQYDAKAEYVRTWGGKGKEPGKMSTPHGLWLDDRPGREASLVVADRANARLQYFTLEGKHIGFVNGLSFPADVDLQGDVLLVPDLHARITLFDKENKVITHLGDDPPWTAEVLKGFQVRKDRKRWKAGKFIHPHDACFDAKGNIFVTEWVPSGRVSKLTRLT